MRTEQERDLSPIAEDTEDRSRLRRPPDSLAEYAVESVRNDLLTGRLAAGSRLTAESVASELGISHIPVREAFRFLEAQGHVVRDGRRGVRVVPVSASEATDLYRTRALLESEANRIGIPRMTADDDLLLVDLVGRMEAAASAGDVSGYRRSNRAFHFVSFERSDRPWLVRFLRNLWDAAARYQSPLFVQGRWRAQHPAHHRAILDALIARDIDQVNELMDHHRTWLIRAIGGDVADGATQAGELVGTPGQHHPPAANAAPTESSEAAQPEVDEHRAASPSVRG